jgi:hypothetical protein
VKTARTSSPLGSARSGITLLLVGALLVAGAVLTGMCRVRPAIAYGSVAALGLASLGIGLGWGWSRLFGRVVAWLNVFLFAMLVVPDWDDGVLTDKQGLHYACGAIALYFLVCAIGLGFKPKMRGATGADSGV